MAEPMPKSELAKELQAITSDKGSAVLRFGDRTYLVVEVESPPSTSPPGVYEVSDPEEIADLKDAADDVDNPTFSTAEAMQHLQSLRKRRGHHGNS